MNLDWRVRDAVWNDDFNLIQTVRYSVFTLEQGVSREIDIDGKVFNIDDLSESAVLKVTSLEFSEQKVTELKNLNALLQKAKLGYVESLKKEIISDKSGLLLNED